jgi:hypothetical protein
MITGRALPTWLWRMPAERGGIRGSLLEFCSGPRGSLGEAERRGPSEQAVTA